MERADRRHASCRLQVGKQKIFGFPGIPQKENPSETEKTEKTEKPLMNPKKLSEMVQEKRKPF
jgi:hypothetical protein